MELRGTTREVVASLEGWLGLPDEPLIVTTSGSTGAPKRVVLSRQAILSSVDATAHWLSAERQWLLALPATYIAGVQVICRSLVAGEAPVLLEDHPSFASAAAAMSEPGMVSLVPTQLHRLLDESASVEALRTLHTVLLGGGPMPAGLRARAAALGISTVATYGSAETAGGCVYDGRPLEGVGLRIGPGGRIEVSGRTLFTAYDGQPGLTAETLVDGWFLTSDAGVIEEGRLMVLGRLDDVVVSGGLNVPAPSVAARLREHPGVVAAEVLGVPDEEWGNRLVAFVVVSTGSTDLGDLQTAREWVAEAHPRAWAPRQLVLLDEMPMLANGKPDRVRLRAMA